MRWAQVDEAVALLREQGRASLALAVAQCHEDMMAYKRATSAWRQRFEELLAKHEPRTNVAPFAQSEE